MIRKLRSLRQKYYLWMAKYHLGRVGPRSWFRKISQPFNPPMRDHTTPVEIAKEIIEQTLAGVIYTDFSRIKFHAGGCIGGGCVVVGEASGLERA